MSLPTLLVCRKMYLPKIFSMTKEAGRPRPRQPGGKGPCGSLEWGELFLHSRQLMLGTVIPVPNTPTSWGH